MLRRHVTETVVPLPGIPDELWQLLVQCLAKAPASRLRASELAARLRELLPLLAGMPPLDVDEPDTEAAEEAAEELSGAAPVTGQPVRRRGAVPLVPGAKPSDSNRDTHTSMRVPAPDELAGEPTARPGPPRGRRPRPGSARNRAVTRRRRLVVAVAALILAAAGVGTWLATSDDTTPHPPTHRPRPRPPRSPEGRGELRNGVRGGAPEA